MTRIARYTYGFRCAHAYDRNRQDHFQRANKIVSSRDGLEMLENGFQPIIHKVCKFSKPVKCD